MDDALITNKVNRKIVWETQRIYIHLNNVKDVMCIFWINYILCVEWEIVLYKSCVVFDGERYTEYALFIFIIEKVSIISRYIVKYFNYINGASKQEAINM